MDSLFTEAFLNFLLIELTYFYIIWQKFSGKFSFENFPVVAIEDLSKK